MLSMNVEILESQTSFDDRPEVVCYLRSLSRHPKIISCFNLIMAVLSSLDPPEASQLLEEVRNDSRFLSTFQVYSNSYEDLFDPTNWNVSWDQVDPNSEENHNALYSKCTPVADVTALESPTSRFSHAGKEFDIVLDEIFKMDQSVPFSSAVHTVCSDPAAESVSETYHSLICQPCWYDTWPQNIPTDLLGPGGLDPAVVEWVLQPVTAQSASHYLITQKPIERKSSQSMLFGPATSIIENVIFRPSDSALLDPTDNAALTLEATTKPSKPKKKSRTRKKAGPRR